MDSIDITSPEDSHVPAHFPFKKIRPLQAAAIDGITEAWSKGYKYVILEAPTGFGKSAVAITLARQNRSAYILVSTKMLQEQYANEEAFKAIQIKGRSNFRCLLSERCACSAGPCLLGRECGHKPVRGSESVPANYNKVADAVKDEIWANPESDLCLYWEKKCDALNHRYPVMNYSYFLSETHHARDFGKRRLMVCDEAHDMEDELMRFISFTISDEHLKLVHCRMPPEGTPITKWVELLTDWANSMTLEFENTHESAMGTKDHTRMSILMEKMQELSKNAEKCVFIAKELSADPDNWLIDLGDKEGARKVTFKPLFVKRYGARFSGMADLFLLQSATIIDPVSLAASLGLPEGECVFMRAGSDFDPGKRPFYYKPIGRMSFKQKADTLPKLAEEIRALISKHPDEKGVIHTHSYDIQRYLMDKIPSPRFMANTRSDYQIREDIIQEFIRSRKPSILVTPSAHEGMDFKDDICRWQVICKIPYPDLKDIQVSKRMAIDRRWYQWKTILRLVQTYGRGTRSDTDWCETYMFDSSFGDLWVRGKDLFPDWFKEAIVRLE